MPSMKEQITELRQDRASIWEQAKALNEKALSEKRDFTAEEKQQYDNMMADMDSKKSQIDRLEAAHQIEQEMSASGNGRQFQQQPGATTKTGRQSEEYKAAFDKYLTMGVNALSRDEIKAMAADPDEQGGYLVAPQQMVEGLLKQVDDAVQIRQFATVHAMTQAKSLGVVTLTEDADDFEWTTELRTGGETDVKVGKRELRPHPLAKRAKISNTLLRLTSGGAGSLLNERLAYKYGVTMEKAYLSADGNSKPLGLFVPSEDGIKSDRDIVGQNTTTAIKADTLIDALYSLKSAYQTNARWLFHRDVLKEIRKLKNGDGVYLWAPGITGGQPDTILSKPFIQSEFAPKTMTTGQYVGLIGDFRFYWIVDALNMQIQRLVELYAETNQTGFIARYEGDGQPVMSEAFTRIKLG